MFSPAKNQADGQMGESIVSMERSSRKSFESFDEAGPSDMHQSEMQKLEDSEIKIVSKVENSPVPKLAVAKIQQQIDKKEHEEDSDDSIIIKQSS